MDIQFNGICLGTKKYGDKKTAFLSIAQGTDIVSIYVPKEMDEKILKIKLYEQVDVLAETRFNVEKPFVKLLDIEKDTSIK